ncbi:MAG TPA: site-specific integrase [Steroidobacteraceae bacterium]
MSLYKRGESWYVDITTPRGRRIRESAKTGDRKAAKEYHDRLKAEAWRVDKLRERPSRTWDEAALRFLKEAEGKAIFRDYKRHIAFWTKHFSERPLEEISRHEAADVVEVQAKTPATRNRYIACLRAVLMKACGAWEWIERAPKFKMYSEPKQRIRWISKEEAETLLAAMPEWLADLARFALATGLRQANVLALEWTQVDLKRGVAWVHPDQAKARRAIGVPLNEDAVAVIRRQLGKDLRFVFVGHDGTPLDHWSMPARKGWDAACKQAGITDFRWHDLRHTWASWHVQQGTPLYVLKELGGWETLEMVKRYAHLAPEHLKEYAERVNFGATSQIRHKEGVTKAEAVA